MENLSAGIGALAFGCWLVAVVSWILAVVHRRPDVPLSRMLFTGYAAFDPSNFTERGQRHQRRFLYGFAGFFVCVLLVFGVVAFGLASG